MNQLEIILSQSLSLFIIVPLIGFFLTILLKNKSEKAIGIIVRVAKLSYIFLAVIFAACWIANGLTPISYKLATIYQTDHFAFAIQFYYFKNGAFEKYQPITNAKEIGTIHNMEKFIEGAREMETNHIVHATEENLPVYLLD